MKDDIKGMMDNLKEKTKNRKVYVVGHNNADVDSYISMLLMSKLLKREGLNAEPLLLQRYDTIDTNTKLIITSLNCDRINYEDKFEEDDLFFLVDHNDPFESIGKKYKNRIIGIIDHHYANNDNKNLIFKIVKKSGSTTKIIYDIYKYLKQHMTHIDKKRVLYSLSVDTCSFMSKKSSEEDEFFGRTLSNDIGIDFSELKNETFFETDMDLPPYKILTNGLKKYNIFGFSIECSYVEILDRSCFFENKMNNVFDLARETSKDLFLIMVKDFKKNQTEIFKFGNLSEKMEIKNKYDFIISRNDVISDIKEKIEKLN